MFRHDLLDGGEQSGTPDGPRLWEATLPMFLHGIAQLWSWGSL
ncbi:hypothetical protein SMA5143A_7214 [Streptomyces sp. MA5143a]|nr:hypothetical protein SMA5143A_7214 [Streptomyces sp. MA5143a]